MWTSLIHFLGNKFNYILSFLNPFINIIKNVTYFNYSSLLLNNKDKNKNKDINKDTNNIESKNFDLFKNPSIYKDFNSTSKNLHSCAVGEFDYDFNSPNPFNWDFQNLILNKNIQSSISLNNEIQQYQNLSSNNLNENIINNNNNNNNNDNNSNNNSNNNNNNNNNNNSNLNQANKILSNFNYSFQNQLKNNDLFQIYQNQNNLHDDAEFSDDDNDDNFNNLLNNCYSKSNDIDIDNDDFIYNSTIPIKPLSIDSSIFNYTELNNKIISNNDHNDIYNYIDTDNDNDNDNILPLDDELMFSIIRNPIQILNMSTTISNFSICPNLTNNDTKNCISSIEKINYLKRQNESNSEYDLESESELNDSLKQNLGENQKIIISSLEPHLNSKNKYRKLSFSSKKSIKKSIELSTSNSLIKINNSNNSNSSDDFDNFKSENKIYKCPVCNTTFKVKSYLTRHKKKHFASKPFQCPFFDPSTDYHDHNNSDNISISNMDGKIPRCHPTGGFSRRDTFKTHLKALHFVYPTGTKSGDRSDKKGRCAGCFKEFQTNKEWLENHVMKNQCDGMITKYK